MPKKIAQISTMHGVTLSDEYAWLKEGRNADVLAYLEAENSYTSDVLKHLGPLETRLVEEMRGRLNERETSVPVRKGTYWYYRRFEPQCEHPMYCRKLGYLEAPEEVLLDVNALAPEGKFRRVGSIRISPDHRWLAFTVDLNGGERYVLRVRELSTAQDLIESTDHLAPEIEWAQDSQTIGYLVLNEAWRPFRLMQHRVGEDAQHDVRLFEEPDERFSLRLSKTKDEQYLVLTSESKTSTETWVWPSVRPEEGLRLIQARVEELEYHLEHHDGMWYLLTNADAINFKVVRVPVDSQGRASWEEVVPHRLDVRIEECEVFKDFLVLYARAGGLPRVEIYALRTGAMDIVSFEEVAYAVGPGENIDFMSDTLRLEYSSPVTPNTVIDYHMGTRARAILKQDHVAGFDGSRYAVERILATARDGVRVPITLVMRRGIPRHEPCPVVLEGYGAYGSVSEARFSASAISVLDRGVIWGLAHIRGGGEFGRTWYDQGKRLNKRTTFSDFIACCETLIRLGYTAPDRLVVTGGSAGGMLMGVIANERPELLRGMVARVPFVDVLNTMLDPTLPLTVPEYEEWGDPHDPETFAYLRSYSPYDNVRRQAYPWILATGGWHDTRVQYWEPAKWVAKLRDHNTGSSEVLLKMNFAAGHQGQTGRYRALEELACEYAFMLDMLGRTHTVPC